MSLPLGAGRLTRAFLPDDPPGREQLARLAGAPAQRKGPFVRRRVTAGDIDTWIPRLAALRAQERAGLRGISRSRSRQIVAGAVVARAAMKALNVRAVDVCPWALREGIILHYLQTTFNQPFDLPLRPLAGSACGTDPPGAPGSRGVSRMALVSAPGTGLTTGRFQRASTGSGGGPRQVRNPIYACQHLRRRALLCAAPGMGRPAPVLPQVSAPSLRPPG
jgi:Ppx/GppA phosphatase family protein